MINVEIKSKGRDNFFLKYLNSDILNDKKILHQPCIVIKKLWGITYRVTTDLTLGLLENQKLRGNILSQKILQFLGGRETEKNFERGDIAKGMSMNFFYWHLKKYFFSKGWLVKMWTIFWERHKSICYTIIRSKNERPIDFIYSKNGNLKCPLWHTFLLEVKMSNMLFN